jgi:hypothetical protein
MVAALGSSSSDVAARRTQLARLRQKVSTTAFRAGAPDPSFDADARALLQAAVVGLTALTDERHERDLEWLGLLGSLVSACSIVLCSAANAWLQQRGESGPAAEGVGWVA